jgi:hypothetical protein
MVEGVGFVVFEKAPFAQMLVNPKFVLDGAEMLDEACRRLAGLEG